MGIENYYESREAMRARRD